MYVGTINKLSSLHTYIGRVRDSTNQREITSARQRSFRTSANQRKIKYFLVTRLPHILTSLDFDKLAKIQDTYKLVGSVSQNSHLPDCVHLSLAHRLTAHL